MNNFKGQYIQYFYVDVTGEDHMSCKHLAKHIVDLCEAWKPDVEYSMIPRPKTYPVLKREFRITHTTDNAHHSIVFRESLKCLRQMFGWGGRMTLEHANTVLKENVE